MRGEDVYALQTALNACGYPCGEPDGILGKITHGAIVFAQDQLKLVKDGLAGGNTQRAVTFHLAGSIGPKMSVDPALLCGQLEFESGPRVGNYSPIRPDGNYDAGVAQRNTKYTPAKQGFNVPVSVTILATNTRKYYDLFSGVLPLRRRWSLAQGAWNAPAYACYLAKKEGAPNVTTSMTLRPTNSQLEVFEEYMRHCLTYF